MHSIEIPVTLRYLIKKPENPGLQNLYIFNMYRAGSSVLEAVAEGLGVLSGREPVNLTRDFYGLGVGLFDAGNWTESNLFLSDNGRSLNKFTQMGGYVFYGFREIPIGFADTFNAIGASVLIVRDLRDIGISHFRAIDTHTTEDSRINRSAINNARKLKVDKTLEEYILSPELLSFIKRLGQCYVPLIKKGIPIIQYESLFDMTGKFSVDRLCRELYVCLEGYAPKLKVEKLIERTYLAIENSKSLKGHGTGGGIQYYDKLSPQVKKRYTEALSEELMFLGYL